LFPINKMLQYLLITPFLMSTILYLTHRPIIVYTKCKDAHRKWVRLKMLVSSNETDLLAIYLASSKMVFQLFYIEVLKYFRPDSVRKLNKTTYEVSYILNAKKYKMLITPYRGPQPVMQVIDHCNNDITELVLPYLGPKFDWHGYPPKPSFFNTKSLTIKWSDDTCSGLY
jgi:hypothetical protein